MITETNQTVGYMDIFSKLAILVYQSRPLLLQIKRIDFLFVITENEWT
jgi:hypothetical protein